MEEEGNGKKNQIDIETISSEGKIFSEFSAPKYTPMQSIDLQWENIESNMKLNSMVTISNSFSKEKKPLYKKYDDFFPVDEPKTNGAFSKPKENSIEFNFKHIIHNKDNEFEEFCKEKFDQLEQMKAEPASPISKMDNTLTAEKNDTLKNINDLPDYDELGKNDSIDKILVAKGKNRRPKRTFLIEDGEPEPKKKKDYFFKTVENNNQKRKKLIIEEYDKVIPATNANDIKNRKTLNNFDFPLKKKMNEMYSFLNSKSVKASLRNAKPKAYFSEDADEKKNNEEFDLLVQDCFKTKGRGGFIQKRSNSTNQLRIKKATKSVSSKPRGIISTPPEVEYEFGLKKKEKLNSNNDKVIKKIKDNKDLLNILFKGKST